MDKHTDNDFVWMTPEEFFVPLRAKQKIALRLMGVCFGAAMLHTVFMRTFKDVQFAENIWTLVMAPPGILAFFILVRVYLIVKRSCLCPHCGKSLSYLLFAPGYATFPGGYYLLPEKPPARMTCCPYCKFSISQFRVPLPRNKRTLR